MKPWTPHKNAPRSELAFWDDPNQGQDLPSEAPRLNLGHRRDPLQTLLSSLEGGLNVPPTLACQVCGLFTTLHPETICYWCRGWQEERGEAERASNSVSRLALGERAGMRRSGGVS